jgi:hypothetical protein
MACYCPHCLSAPGKPLIQEYPPNPSRLNREYSQVLPERTRTRPPSAHCSAATPTVPPSPRRSRGPYRPPHPARQGSPSVPPGPLRSATSTRTRPSLVSTATVTVSPGAPDPEYSTLLPNNSLASKTASSSRGCPGPSTRTRTRGRHAPAPGALPASPSRGRPAQPSPHLPPDRPCPGNRGDHQGNPPACTPDSAARVKSVRPGRPARPCVRKSRRCTPTALAAPRPSAMRPWTPQRDGLQRDKMTHAGTEKKQPRPDHRHRPRPGSRRRPVAPGCGAGGARDPRRPHPRADP